MRNIIGSISIIIIFFINSNFLFAQQTENWLDNNDIINYRKLYIHTDREFYFQGDTVWFKAYQLHGQSQQFVNGIYNLYLDLLDHEGKSIQSQVLPIFNGLCSGNIPISDSLNEGNYILRSYTDFQKAYGEDAFFYKTLNVSEVNSSVELLAKDSIEVIPQFTKPDLAFLPEGGFLLEGQQNVIGIKAIDQYGKDLSIRGSILNSNEQQVAFFKTEYKGMSKLYFTPQPGEIYTAKIEGYPDYTYDFTEMISEGIKLGFISEKNDKIVINITSNSKSFDDKKYLFAIMHRGKVIVYQEFVKKEKNIQIKINSRELPAGINRIVLLDANLKPLSERLFFSRNFEVNDIQIRLNQETYRTRSNVQLELHDGDSLANQSFSSLSLAVVDESAVGAHGSAFNIMSWLLIDSELKGIIESPSDFFKDDESTSSRNKLDLLMLTHGWSKYLWNTISESDNLSAFKLSEGITISGRVKRLLSKKPIVNGDIVLGLMKGDYPQIYESKTDESGRFSIDNIFFTDTASVFVQARNSKGKLSTKVILDPIFEERPNISNKYLQIISKFKGIPLKLSQQKYFNDLAMKAYILEKGLVMLPELTIKGQRIEKDDVPNRVYPKPATSLKISQTDELTGNVLNFLQGRVAGVVVSKDGVLIRGISSVMLGSEPLWLLNGAQVSSEVILSLPMYVIDRVEIHKTPIETVIFGTRGVGGAISVYTKQGGQFNTRERPAKGAISAMIKGYESYREFYSPKYSPENIDSERPDNRITLYWNPNIITENGMASLSFFTSDDISNYKVFVEGITLDGKICIGAADFSVTN